RKYAHVLGNHPLADRFQARAIRLCGSGSYCDSDDGYLLHLAAGDQCFAAMAVTHGKEGAMSVAIVPAHLTEPRWLRLTLTIIALGLLALFLVLPLALVFIEAFSRGWRVYLASVTDPDARAAIRLTLLVAAVALPLNLVFGVAAAWALTRFQFRGKQFLIPLIDLPLSISPVVAG